MSLDVYLVSTSETPHLDEIQNRIFIREDGQTKEISREEWDVRFPDREPVTITGATRSTEVYSANITHNMGQMAAAVDLYKPLWRPEEIGITHARDLIEPLREGLKRLLAEKDELLQYNPQNGWGNYDIFVNFTADYLAACELHPHARVETSR